MVETVAITRSSGKTISFSLICHEFGASAPISLSTAALSSGLSGEW